MPGKSARSGLVGKLGTVGQQAVEKHRSDETKLAGGAKLPPGIEGGIAQLTLCKFGKYDKGENQGEYFFMARGVTIEPVEHDGIPCRGIPTQIGPEPLCDTPKKINRPNLDAHIDWVLNEFRKLGVDTDQSGIEDLEDMAAALEESKPHFRFRTWESTPNDQFPNKRTFEDWRGHCEYNGEVTDEVVDETDDSSEGDDIFPFGAKVESLIILGKSADEGNEDAEKELERRSDEVGIDPENFGTWEEVATAIEGGDDASTSETIKIPNPTKSDLFFFKPPRARKFVECEVTAVFAGKKVCNLKNLTDGKIYKAVPWDRLREEE